MNKVSSTRFSNKITKVSFWLSICVVFIHANNTLTYQFDMNNSFEKMVYVFENWAQGWQQCAVPLFFIISGFLFFKNYTSDKLISKWKSRCKTLLVPYLIWTHIPWIALSLFKLTPYGAAVNTEASFTFESWLDFVWFCNGTVLWYVRSTMIFVLLTPIIHRFLQYKKISLISIMAIIFSNIVLIATHMSAILEFYWCPVYLLGAWIAVWRPNWFIERASKRNRLIAMAIFAVLLMLAIANEYTLHTPLTQYLYKMSLPLPLWFALDIFEFEQNPCWIEQLSFPIYCTHAIILESLEKIVLVLMGNRIPIALVSYLILPVIVVGVLIVIFYCLNRYVPKVYQVLFGSRG